MKYLLYPWRFLMDLLIAICLWGIVLFSLLGYGPAHAARAIEIGNGNWDPEED
jgi:hypothetical protein